MNSQNLITNKNKDVLFDLAKQLENEDLIELIKSFKENKIDDLKVDNFKEFTPEILSKIIQKKDFVVSTEDIPNMSLYTKSHKTVFFHIQVKHHFYCTNGEFQHLERM